ncbi:hypothetical protein, partial [Candidatus Hakubella thermalkaliphila]|uniref:hypothetical protein n=1 Tax=Candidatus Hakubella thermalkaliphila TaxID=2754717 RepID=UPI001593714F
MFITLLPLLITVQALVFIVLVSRFAGGEALMDTILRTGVAKLEEMMPTLSSLPVIEKFQMFFFPHLGYFSLADVESFGL